MREDICLQAQDPEIPNRSDRRVVLPQHIHNLSFPLLFMLLNSFALYKSICNLTISSRSYQ